VGGTRWIRNTSVDDCDRNFSSHPSTLFSDTRVEQHYGFNQDVQLQSPRDLRQSGSRSSQRRFARSKRSETAYSRGRD
jgi:hypothetical protein